MTVGPVDPPNPILANKNSPTLTPRIVAPPLRPCAKFFCTLASPSTINNHPNPVSLPFSTSLTLTIIARMKQTMHKAALNQRRRWWASKTSNSYAASGARRSGHRRSLLFSVLVVLARWATCLLFSSSLLFVVCLSILVMVHSNLKMCIVFHTVFAYSHFN